MFSFQNVKNKSPNHVFIQLSIETIIFAKGTCEEFLHTLPHEDMHS
jgi:hypothetical protein